ncbi:hypothetical protein KC19_VG226700 [Ceratodon purpureus]|uniref:VTT domain-containing protein n=1 Tax=Ceratodon purpureus TaxID=3225 RepID=A0A8T0HTC8_CERPU|nr:hypothetical protein KC19_VG226700 [Ceratodon purpureus]
MKVVKLATSAKLRVHLAGKRPSLDIDRKGRRWRVNMSTRAWRLLLTITAILLSLGVGIQLPQFSHYVEQTLKQFLIWVQNDAGAWGPIILALAYVPCSVLAIPASILTLGGGYLFGLGVGFVTDSLGSTLGATAAFLVGRTIGRTYVTSKLKDYPRFQAIAIAVRKSGFKPMTLAFVYVGTTIKDIQDISHGGAHFTRARVIMLSVGFAATSKPFLYFHNESFSISTSGQFKKLEDQYVLQS